MQPVGYMDLYVPSSNFLSFLILLSLVINCVFILFVGSLGIYASLVLVVKLNVGYITSHSSIKVLQQPQLPVGMPKLA